MKNLSRFAVCILLGTSMMLAQGKRLPSSPGGPAKSGAALQGGVKSPSYGGCDSTTPTTVADGSLVQDYVAAAAWAIYAFGVQPGHSYSAEVWNPFGQDFTSSDGRPSLGVADSTCYYVPYTDVSGMAPALNRGFSARVSWTAGNDPLAYVGLLNFDYSYGYIYNIRITDTTLHNPRWTTYGGFETSFGFMNTTNAAISGTLTMIDTAGAKYVTNVTIPAGSQVFKIASATGGDITLGRGDAGSADFTFVGPAGAIVGDAYYLNGSATVVVPSSFGPRNYQH